MIIFDQLRISDNGYQLFINAHVNKAAYFDNIEIDKIIIQTSDQVSETDPLTPGDDYIYSLQVEEGTREINLVLDSHTDFDKVYHTLSDKLLFVYIICKGIADPCTPCRLDELTTLGVTFDDNLLYQKVMQYTRTLADTCVIPKDFIDLILLWNGFKAAIETEHYLPAIDFWKRMFDRKHGLSGFSKTKPCGCHG